MQKRIQEIKNTLEGFYPSSEIESFIFLLFNHLFGYSKFEIQLNTKKQLSKVENEIVDDCIIRLQKKEPIQYILGETEFYNLPIKCRKGALIPRFETEELVDYLLKQTNLIAPKIIDLGTGTGCIPIALKKNLPKAEVQAVDVSVDALRLAQENAMLNDVEVTFHQFDLLSGNWSLPTNYFDLIVSNPPYVLDSEKELMEDNVLHYEPHLALFVANDDPLIFYEAIARIGWKHLTKNGKIYLEINEAYGIKTVQLMNDFGYSKVQLMKDLNGKDRFVIAEKNE